MHGFDNDDLMPAPGSRPERDERALRKSHEFMARFLVEFSDASQNELAALKQGKVGPLARRALGVDYWNVAQDDRLRRDYQSAAFSMLAEEDGVLKVAVRDFKPL